MSSALISWRSLSTQILERRAHLARSLRVTIAALLAFAVSNLLSLRLPLWTVLTAMILTQANFGRSVKATVDYLAGTVGGAIYAGAVSVLVPHSNELSLAAVLALAVAPLALMGAIIPSFAAAPFTGALGAPGSRVRACRPDRIRRRPCAGGRDRRNRRAWRCRFSCAPARAQTLRDRGRGSGARSDSALASGLVCRAHRAASIRRRSGVSRTASAKQWCRLRRSPRKRGTSGSASSPCSRSWDLCCARCLRLRHDLVMIGRAAAAPLPDAIQERLGSPLLRGLRRA